MQNVKGGRGTSTKVYEDFNPSMDWTQDSTSHILIIDLPGFRREDLKVQIDDTRKLIVYGERQVAGSKYKRFKNIVTMLQDADIANISAKFEHGILFITMPKIMSKSTDKEPQFPAVDTEKEAAPKVVDRKDQEASKEAAPQKKEDDVREEAMEKMHKDTGEDIHQRVVENHKDEKQCGERDEKKEKVRSEEKKTVEKCRDGVKEGGDVGEKLKERVRSTLGWIGEKVKGGMEMQDVESVGGRLLDVARKNKEVIAAAVVAFAFGFYVSKRLSR